MKVAIIDIGSNSLRLLLGDNNSGRWINCPKKIWTTRLGERDMKGLLTEGAIQASLSALSEIATEIKLFGAERVVGLATSAVRESENGMDFLSAARFVCPMETHILSGEEEAYYGFRGALGELLNNGMHYTTIDIGGGSTELALGSKDGIYWSRSYPVGAVRCKKLSDEGPQRIWQETTGLWDPMPIAGPFADFVALGGTATTLAAIHLGLREYDATKIQGCYLSREVIEALVIQIRYATLQERAKIVGLPEKRRDIIVAGAEILTSFMDAYEVPGIVVSDYDAMEGYEHTLE